MKKKSKLLEPLYDHDCPDCHFMETLSLGEKGQAQVSVDSYYCAAEDRSIVIRYGDNESDMAIFLFPEREKSVIVPPEKSPDGMSEIRKIAERMVVPIRSSRRHYLQFSPAEWDEVTTAFNTLKSPVLKSILLGITRGIFKIEKKED